MDGTTFITSSFALQNTPALQTNDLVVSGSGFWFWFLVSVDLVVLRELNWRRSFTRKSADTSFLRALTKLQYYVDP